MTAAGDRPELSTGDLAVDHRLSLLAQSFRFLLDLTPVDADDLRDGFLAGRDPDPAFTYRELETDPDVVRAELDSIDLGDVEDPVLGQLLRAKHREMGTPARHARGARHRGLPAAERRAVRRRLAGAA